MAFSMLYGSMTILPVVNSNSSMSNFDYALKVQISLYKVIGIMANRLPWNVLYLNSNTTLSNSC